MPAPKKTSAVRDKVAKSGDTLDMAPVVKEAMAHETLNLEEAKKIIAEIQEVQGTPDMPERWGHRAPLTIASPGHIVNDPTYIPETVKLYDGTTRRVANHRIIRGQMHTLTADSQRKYRWCRDDGKKIPVHQRRGFAYSKYDTLFKDTGLFQRGPGGIVRNGDVILMEVSLDGWDRMVAEKKKLQSMLEGSYGSELFSVGEQVGAPTFQDDLERGTRNFMT